jgi:predicted nucleotidyltransferase component of viral defense system
MHTDGILAVEEFHLLFLSQLGVRVDKKLYAVKGGCNLRFFFKSIRYSQDIDFDVHTIARDTLRKNVNQILKSPGFRGILRTSKIELIHVSEPKQTDTTQRWKVQVRAEGSPTNLPTKIEFSRRKFDEGVVFEAVDAEITRIHGIRPILASHYGLKAAFAQKIDALVGRSQTQARDIFDLALLADRTAPDFKLPKDTEKAAVAAENAISVSFNQFKSQVVAYLPPEYQEYYGAQKTWESLQENVVKILESL